MPPPKEIERTQKKNSCSKRGKTVILTSSPYKKELEIEMGKKEDAKKAKEPEKKSKHIITRKKKQPEKKTCFCTKKLPKEIRKRLKSSKIMNVKMTTKMKTTKKHQQKKNFFSMTCMRTQRTKRCGYSVSVAAAGPMKRAPIARKKITTSFFSLEASSDTSTTTPHCQLYDIDECNVVSHEIQYFTLLEAQSTGLEILDVEMGMSERGMLLLLIYHTALVYHPNGMFTPIGVIHKKLNNVKIHTKLNVSLLGRGSPERF
ncbi:hypothetical protein J437_LFUL005132 [Ladona fulva]|uniref:Uncharacterized protein n=1 Tax=Ladona fulva TaxID=123851 RepID=A0A8K0KEZ7_LADFU|nr:hypothetical protein J437_LFUL005132 [Ladona fulva]